MFLSILACAMTDEKYVLQRFYACTLRAGTYLHLQKENVIPLFLHSVIQSGSTPMQECFNSYSASHDN